METLIALRGEMDEEFARAANKQGKFSSHDVEKLYKMLSNVAWMWFECGPYDEAVEGLGLSRQPQPPFPTVYYPPRNILKLHLKNKKQKFVVV